MIKKKLKVTLLPDGSKEVDFQGALNSLLTSSAVNLES